MLKFFVNIGGCSCHLSFKNLKPKVFELGSKIYLALQSEKISTKISQILSNLQVKKLNCFKFLNDASKT